MTDSSRTETPPGQPASDGASEEKPAEKESLLTRWRNKYGWFDHLLRAAEAFNERYGNHYAAAITYFSVLSLFPLLMIAVSVAGLVLAGNQDLLDELRKGITQAVPPNLRGLIRSVVDSAIESAGAVGVLGLLTALYSGIGWIGNLRDALTAQWGQEKKQLPFLKKILWDLLALAGLGLALVFSFAVTAVGSGLGKTLLMLVGLDGEFWAGLLLKVATIVLTLAANWAVFVWVISRLPRERVSSRSAVRGALAAAIGFVILQQVASIYLASVASSPTGALFGPIIGLLVFANLVSRFLLFITAWTATARENTVRDVESPPPAVIRPRVQVRKGASPRQAAGLFGVGAATALILRKLRRRR